MRYLELILRRPPSERHPMHQFVVEHDGYVVARQLYHHQYRESEHAFVFHVDGPVAPYRQTVQDVQSVLEFEIATCSDGSFYVYVRERVTAPDQDIIDAFSQPGLILAHPIEYRPDRSIQLAVIGPTDAVQSAADAISEKADTEIGKIGEFPSSRIDSRLGLTERQFEAVRAAVECGYYEVPREGALDDIAARLDCSTGTAGELLRRAEQTVMADLVAGGRF